MCEIKRNLGKNGNKATIIIKDLSHNSQQSPDIRHHMNIISNLFQKGKILTSKAGDLLNIGRPRQNTKTVGFPGIWMTESESVIYRVMPKCACSTIGQILYFTDHGVYYDGDIHDANSGIHKWRFEASKPLIARGVRELQLYTFTSVRNPYSRVLSAYFDKICGIQRNGRRYCEKYLPLLEKKYGIEVGGKDGKGEFDQIKSFRRFLKFAHDTIVTRRPMFPDIHWSPMDWLSRGLIVNGGHYDNIFFAEKFKEGMQSVLDAIEVRHPIDLSKVPRFNESEGHGPKRLHAVEDYFDDQSMHLIYEMYHRDFDLFKYDFENPSNMMPVGEIDLHEIHAKLAR